MKKIGTAKKTAGQKKLSGGVHFKPRPSGPCRCEGLARSERMQRW